MHKIIQVPTKLTSTKMMMEMVWRNLELPDLAVLVPSATALLTVGGEELALAPAPCAPLVHITGRSTHFRLYRVTTGTPAVRVPSEDLKH